MCLLFVLGLFSCGDNCDDVECGPGFCNDGTCDCPEGREGDACEIVSNSVYYGVYAVVDDTCGATNNTTNIESIIIGAHPNGNPLEIELTAASSTSSATIDGTIVEGNLEAEGPFSSFILEISATFSDNDNFEARLAGAGLVCSGVTYAK